MLSPTFSFLLEGLGLGDSEALHHLVALTSLLVLRARLIGWPDQHPAAEGMAVAPGRFLRPRNSIYWGKGGEEGLLGAAPCTRPPRLPEDPLDKETEGKAMAWEKKAARCPGQG